MSNLLETISHYSDPVVVTGMRDMADTPAERKAKRAWAAREREKDPEGFKQRQLEAQKRYYEKHAEKIKAKKRAHHAANLEACRARTRDEYQRNKPARVAASKRWKEQNREKYLAGSRVQNLKKYGLTPETYDAMFTSQGNCCAICKSDNPQSRTGWHIDHCHTTGKTRSILCQPCNVGLGAVKDDATTLKRMIAYLEHHQ